MGGGGGRLLQGALIEMCTVMIAQKYDGTSPYMELHDRAVRIITTLL